MIDYPGAIAFPAHPSNTLGPPCVPKGIVLHTPEEKADGYPGTPVWFAQPHPGAEGSTHYFVSYHGFMYQCVRESVAAIANGVIGKPYPLWANPGQSLNRQSTNIEIEGYAATIGQTMPRGSGQWKALIDWIVFECRKWNIPCDRAHIIGHYEVSNNRSDPGTLNINAVVQDAQAGLQEDDFMAALTEVEQKELLQKLRDLHAALYTSKAGVEGGDYKDTVWKDEVIGRLRAVDSGK